MSDPEWWETEPSEESLADIDLGEDFDVYKEPVPLPPGYELLENLCKKSLAQVSLAMGPTGICVVKQPRKNNLHGPHKIENEYDKLQFLHRNGGHPYLPKPLAVSKANGKSFLALHYIPGMDLAAYTKRMHDNMETVPLAFYIQLAETLEYVHDHRVVHKEVKPGNVVIGEDGNAYLIDFGPARFFDEEENALTWQSNRGFGAPETLTGGVQFGKEADIYSLCKTIIYGLSLVDPTMSELGPMDVHAFVADQPGELLEALAAGVDPEPRDRPDIADIIYALHEAL